jgi:hypothetical protein
MTLQSIVKRVERKGVSSSEASAQVKEVKEVEGGDGDHADRLMCEVAPFTRERVKNAVELCSKPRTYQSALSSDVEHGTFSSLLFESRCTLVYRATVSHEASGVIGMAGEVKGTRRRSPRHFRLLLFTKVQRRLLHQGRLLA